MSTHAFANPFAPFNPFLPVAPPSPAIEEPVEATEYSYALVQSGPAVAPEEVESAYDTIEVKVSWGAQVLSLSHLEAAKGFTVGEGGDFELPNAMCSAVVERRGGLAYAVVPIGASATVSRKGEVPVKAAAGEEIALMDGVSVTIELEPVTIAIASVRAGKKIPIGFLASLASGAAAAIGLSFLGHTAVVAAMAMFMPSMNADDAEGITREQILSMQTMMNASAEREQEQQKHEEQGAADPTGGGSKGGEPHKGESGVAGTTKPVTTSGHMAFKGSDDHARLPKKEEMDLAATGGFVGILNSGAPVTGPSSPWATETQLGTDADNKIGAMFGATADDAMGAGGLGLTGVGEGGGGKGDGIGIDGVGATVGGGGGGPGKWGYGKGDKDGIGNGHGPGAGAHIPKPPIMRTPKIDTNGHLPPEVIQRIVRQNFGRFRLCYEAGLRTNPGLTGRVTTKFIIGRDGLVSTAQDGGSDMPSQEVVSCVVRGFNNLSFPQPEGGVATVSYPIVFSPGE